MKNTILNSATKLTLLIVVIAVVALNFVQIDVKEPLKSITLMIISFYFGQKSLTPNEGGHPANPKIGLEKSEDSKS